MAVSPELFSLVAVVWQDLAISSNIALLWSFNQNLSIKHLLSETHWTSMRDRGESTGPRAKSQVTTQSQRWDMCRGENREQGNKYSVAVCESVHIVGVCGNNECSLEQSRWYQEGDRTWLGLEGVSRRLGEQPEQRYRGWGFPRGHWSREDTAPVEHRVC